MSDNILPVTLPSFVTAMLSSGVRVVMAAIGGWLLNHGYLSQQFDAAAVQEVTGTALLIATVAWAWVVNHTAQKRLSVAVSTPNLVDAKLVSPLPRAPVALDTLVKDAQS